MNNSSKNNTSYRGGIGFTGLLTIAFIVLKLLDVISWSWFWVLSPIWISCGIVTIILLVALCAITMTSKRRKKWNTNTNLK